ncbi:MAG: hypothetical protein UV74_C0013G0432 [Candidatus Woesebacteria bacterium GW2011_GWB1_43_14]|uniref:Uncharacterized protein n=1 Tax=Candidatus Woesebacteria bacterium GW2011_GWB1_43_14 TaxID=1618578 RepID=A0A0G1DHG9_9BACT|nr:MAG: hypothetical protein UT21_C0001G0144 [Candidatus Woesebacteria bacterium GW2011_GWA1_39_11b]KKS77511.1 MAG: hypothetical protein UV51_C0006G0028 [Candidatus Woesebacteria bacterium GW2011_GWC1_42_9]KKS97310.1 MAG: hypothetical protein UV74_C0013G0432 [Candidatus Woesebacteria bacterium GW2011_GWB1_43_14]
MQINLERISDIPSKLSQTAQYNLPGGYSFEPSFWHIGLILFLLFLLILMLGQLRGRLVGWQLKGIIPGMMFGAAMVLVIEGAMVYGWQSAPDPVAEVLHVGRGKMVDILGVTDSLESKINEMSSEELSSLRGLVCTE